MLYEDDIKQALELDPLGKTFTDLMDTLPEDADADAVQSTLETLADRGRVQQIGDQWRWVDV